MVKYVFVTGGVVSGLGKGITAASLGRLLKARGFRVTMQKFDPYINVDPGTMNPIQHGEVFVTDDGCETDLDLGHYERFIDESLTRNSNVTTGKVYQTVLNKERHGDYGGGTVQVIPHITNEIKSRFHTEEDDGDVTVSIVEVGGTVGDIESQPFLEAIRQFRIEQGIGNTAMVHVTLIPYIKASGELKTKPTQMSVKNLQSMGLWPDILVCRSDYPLDDHLKEKVALFCNVKKENVLENLDAPSLYDVPLMLEKEGFADAICKLLNLPIRTPDLSKWEEITVREKNPKYNVKISLVGKYVALHDAYLSVVEALKHSGIAEQAKVEINWVDSEDIEKDGAEKYLKGSDGILVPGGFGVRGTEGKIEAVRYARENKIPFLGLCLGMQVAIIEFARNVCELAGANSSELNPDTMHPVIDLMPEQNGVVNLGGTLRLGAYPCKLDKSTKAYALYGQENISERHRHRYEVNNEYKDVLVKNGMVLSGMSPDGRIVEMIELKDHPYFLATQAHPEFKSRPDAAHPLFKGLVEAAVKYMQQKK
ncbi:MAG: CTP synthase [Lachnospiraceae bacterium]|nr:CTP synthase [Lachnospiraceae bacterium]MBR5760914.1 CTP synthase [Lachnospiraceae bacterium]